MSDVGVVRSGFRAQRSFGAIGEVRGGYNSNLPVAVKRLFDGVGFRVVADPGNALPDFKGVNAAVGGNLERLGHSVFNRPADFVLAQESDGQLVHKLDPDLVADERLIDGWNIA